MNYTDFKDAKISEPYWNDKRIIKYVKLAALFIIGFIIVTCSIEIVPAGHVKVGRVFGKVQAVAISEGLNFVNPVANWTLFDGRQKSLKITAEVPSRDQLTTKFEMSIQYRLSKNMASQVLKETGTFEKAVEVHLVPRVRSLIREQGASVKKAEDFFKDEVKRKIQVGLLHALKLGVEPKGILIGAILIRDVNLPPFIVKAIEKKKEREQDAEREVAELKRFRTEQEKLLATAEAELAAERKRAETKVVRADAEYYYNLKLSKSLTPIIVRQQTIEKWDGKLPHVSGSNTPFINLKGMVK